MPALKVESLQDPVMVVVANPMKSMERVLFITIFRDHLFIAAWVLESPSICYQFIANT